MLENIKNEVTRLVAEIIEVPVEELAPGADFANDLGVDSMKAIEISAAIEKKFKIIIPESEIPKVRNLNQVLELTERLIKA
jgi:acyl carrier protein